MSVFGIDRAAGAVLNPLSFADYPQAAHRICTCGVQDDGSLLAECPNCAAYSVRYRIFGDTDDDERIAELLDEVYEIGRLYRDKSAEYSRLLVDDESTTVVRNKAYRVMKKLAAHSKAAKKLLRDALAILEQEAASYATAEGACSEQHAA